MDSYNVYATKKAQTQLTSYADYIYYTLLNPIAAQRLLHDARETREQLSTVAGSLQYCQHPVLRKRGYRAIALQQHQYVMLYTVEGRDVYIEAIYHQRQDYENVFASELE